MENKQVIYLSLIFGLGFLFLGIITHSHYGINWDEPNHFYRGQAYLHFFLSGGKKREELSSYSKKSIYWDKDHQAESYLKNDGGHPPINDLLYALSNKIFFEKLKLLPDVEAYNLMGIFLVSFLVFLLTFMVKEEVGFIAALVSGFSLAFYPSFLAESHFNIKDPPQAVFYSVTLLFLYQAVKRFSWQFLILSGIFFGFALGTKFNILFLPFIIIPWLFFYSLTQKRKPIFPRAKRLLFFLLLLPVIFLLGFLILFLFWPYLWGNPLGNLQKVFSWYLHIGSRTNYEPEFLFAGFNLYPIIWIIFTTPLPMVVLSLLGIFFLFVSLWKKISPPSFLLLALFWLFVPIARVTLPQTSIYGGSRQIIELVPAMAIFAGYGAQELLRILPTRRKKMIIALFLIGGFSWHLWRLSVLHPNETMFFNELIGGLAGAYQHKIPFAGEDLGNVYRQGINWLNNEAESKAKFSLVIRGGSAIPETFLRPDIVFSDKVWSGQQHAGEYLMETTYQGWISGYYYLPTYLERFLEPVYEVKVEGVPVLKIWKNAPEYVRPNLLGEDNIMVDIESLKEGEIILSLAKVVSLLRIEFFWEVKECQELKMAEIATSLDKNIWATSANPLTKESDPREYSLKENSLTYHFPGEKASWVWIRLSPKESCLAKATKAKVWFVSSDEGNNN